MSFISAGAAVFVAAFCFFMANELEEKYGYYLKYVEDAQREYQMWQLFTWVSLVAAAIDFIWGMVLLYQAQESPASPSLVTCPDCYKMVSKSADQCPHCGRKLTPVKIDATLVQLNADGSWICVCGHKNNAARSDCGKCGRQKEPIAEQRVVSQHTADNGWVCVECGHANYGNRSFCGECGRRR